MRQERPRSAYDTIDCRSIAIAVRIPPLSLGSKGWLLTLAFLFACPFLLSLPLGMFQAGYGAFLPLELSIVFWATLWLVTWWVAETFLWLLRRFLKPWDVPVLAQIVLSYVLALLCSAFYVPEIMRLFEPYTINLIENLWQMIQQQSPWERVLNAARSGISGLLFWTVLRTSYAALPDQSAARAGQAPSEASLLAVNPALAPALPPRPQRLTKFRRELLKAGISDPKTICALQARDHYVEVLLPGNQSVLALSRFSDAIEDLVGMDGIRIHRSYWISRGAIGRLVLDGNAMQIELFNGERWPVSTKYRGHVEYFIAHPQGEGG